MAFKGQVLHNPFTGDRYEFLATSRDTDGDFVKIKVTLGFKGIPIPNHIHLYQDERFEVIYGKLAVMAEGDLFMLYPGDAKEIPKKQSHNHYKGHNSRTVYIQTIAPALDFEYLLETLDRLGREGKIRNGRIGFLQKMVLLKYIDSKRVLADVPMRLQNVLVNTFAPLGRILGHRAIYKKYSGIEK